MIKKMLCTLGLIFLFCFPALAENKNFVVTATAWLGDNQTKNEARQLATLEAKRQALEQAGVYLESLTLVQNSQLKKDEILAITGGVTRNQILAEKPTTNQDSFGLQVTVQVTVDTDSVERHIQALLQNRDSLMREQVLLERNRTLEAQLKQYKTELARLKNAQQARQLRDHEGKQIENKLSASALFEAAVTKHHAQDYQQAIDLYTRALQADPQFVAALNSRGAAHFSVGQKQKALSDFQSTLKLDPNYAPAYVNRGLYYDREGKLNSALADYQRALVLNPQLGVAYGNRGGIYFKQGKYDQALNDFNHAIRLNPYYAQAYSNRGVLFNQWGQRQKALADHNKALELAPDYAIGYINRALVLNQLGQPQQALIDLNTAIQLDPNQLQAYAIRAALHFSLNNKNAALADWQKACQMGHFDSCGLYQSFSQSR